MSAIYPPYQGIGRVTGGFVAPIERKSRREKKESGKQRKGGRVRAKSKKMLAVCQRQ
jgi:hypothetical protein